MRRESDCERVTPFVGGNEEDFDELIVSVWISQATTDWYRILPALLLTG